MRAVAIGNEPTLEFYESFLWLLPALPSDQEQTGTPTHTPQCAYMGRGLPVRLENKITFYSYSFFPSLSQVTIFVGSASKSRGTEIFYHA